MCVTLASRKISRFREDNAPPCDVMLHAESYEKRVTSHYPEICDASRNLCTSVPIAAERVGATRADQICGTRKERAHATI